MDIRFEAAPDRARLTAAMRYAIHPSFFWWRVGGTVSLLVGVAAPAYGHWLVGGLMIAGGLYVVAIWPAITVRALTAEQIAEIEAAVAAAASEPPPEPPSEAPEASGRMAG
jgi:hypothetical protein